MKRLILLFTIQISLVTFAQNSTQTLKVVPIVEDRIHELDGGSLLVFGKSRVIIPIVLPENTIEWYYVFSSYSNSEVVQSKTNRLNLASQLTTIIDKTGTTASALSYLLTPSGSSASNIYLFEDHENAINFEHKTDQALLPTYWRPRFDFSIKSATHGKQKVELTNKKYYLGIQAGTSPVIVKIDVVAIVDESVGYSNGWTTQMKVKIKGLMKEAFLKNEVPILEAEQLSDCILNSIVKDYPQDIFLGFEERTINSLLEAYAKVCYKKEIKIEETDEQTKASYYGDLGWRYFENGDMEKAIEYSNKALELEENLGYVHANLGLFYLIQEDEEKANEYYVDAILNFKKDKIQGKLFLKAAIDDIKSSQGKIKSTSDYYTILQQLEKLYENW